MQRRILLIANPVPLLCSDTSGGSCSGATSRSHKHQRSTGTSKFQTGGHQQTQQRDQITTVAQDLWHLQRVLDQISLFCKLQQSLFADNDLGVRPPTLSYGTVPTPKLEPQRAGAKPVQTDNRRHHTRPKPGLRSRNDPRVLLAAVFPCPPTPKILSNRSGSRHTAHVTSDIHKADGSCGDSRPESSPDNGAAALKPDKTFPGVPEEVISSPEREHRLLEIAKAFADVLENGCGVWLPPEEFETCVLAPTRAFIEAQLEDDSSSCRRGVIPPDKPPPVAGEDRTPPAVIAVNESTSSSVATIESGGALSSADSGNTPRRLSSNPTANSSSRDGGSSAASVRNVVEVSAGELQPSLEEDVECLGAFVRGVAEDMVMLLREAASVDSEEGEGEGVRTSEAFSIGDGRGRGGKDARVLLDVVWAASSMPLEGEPSSASYTPAPTRTSEAVKLSRDSRLDETVEGGVVPMRAPTPALMPKLTLSLPAAYEEQATPLREALRMACCHSPGSRVVIWPAIPAGTDGISGIDEGNEDCRSGERKDYGGIGNTGCRERERAGARPVMDSERSDVSRGSMEEEGTVAATDLAAGEEKRLRRLWASWCESTGARLFLGGMERVGGSRERNIEHGPFESGLLWRGPVSTGPSRPPTPGFPALEGFSLRVTPSWLAAMMGGGNDVCGVTGVGSSAASILARAPALRLARAISPATALRSCHLLADGTSAPALELSVCDRDRFPGSAAFLERCAANRTGLLLVAAAPLSMEACAGRGHYGLVPEWKEEGLAMVCFPTFPRWWEGKPPDGTSTWSVTLIRRPFEFSEDAVDALVEESGTWELGTRCREVGAFLPPSMGVSPGKTKSYPSSLPIAVEGEYREEDKWGGLEEEGDGVASSIASLPFYTGDELGALRTEICRFWAEVKVLPPPPEARDSCPSAPVEGVVASDVSLNSDDVVERTSRSKTSRTATCTVAAVESRKRRKIEPSGSVNGKFHQKDLPTLSGLSAEGTDGVGAEMESSSVSRAVRLLRSNATEKAKTASTTVQAVGGGHAARDSPKLCGASAPAGGRTPGSTFLCPSAETTIYASFGAWHDHGVGCDDVRFSWAEEALLPGAARSRARQTTANVSARTSSSCSKGEGAFESGVSRGEKPRLLEIQEGVTPALAAAAEAGATRGEIASSRPLSTAEQALEKAGEKQRARKKERRLVAKEQSARMNQPRPRPRVAGSSSSGGGGGIGPGRVGRGSKVRRGGSLTARATSVGAGGVGTGTLGRSLSGSKLCRGSLILGRSVGGDVKEPVDRKMATKDDRKSNSGSSSSSVWGKTSPGAAGITDSGETKEAVFLDSRCFYRGGDRGKTAKDVPASGMKKAADSGLVRRATTGSSSSNSSDGQVRRKILEENDSEGRKGSADATRSGKRNPVEGIGLANGGRERGTLGKSRRADGVTRADRDPGTSDSAAASTSCGEGFGGVGGSHSTMRQVMERAMLSAIASQMGLSEEDPLVRDVFERESIRMSGAGAGTGRRK